MKLSGRWFPHIVDSGNLYPIYMYIYKIVGDFARPSCLVIF